jgi:hypothetical protein
MNPYRSFILWAALLTRLSLVAASNQILSWNNLGMHCMDSDYSVFSILPPYNTIESQLIVGGKLVTNDVGYRITYQAIADPTGSFNATAMGKGNFYTYAPSLFGVTLDPEAGLAGWSMPGTNNVPQDLRFEQTNQPATDVFTRVNWFRAEGIPISPYDDALRKNPYPLMRLIAWNGAKQPVATNDIVLPVSDEMDCRGCHASGTTAAAKPASGWVWDGLPERDYRLNILRLHDERQFEGHAALYAEALDAWGFNPRGLFQGVLADNKPVLCATCHASEALGTSGYSPIPPLTAAIHTFHAHVRDLVLKTTLDDSANRAACYRCHPGSTTRCLRGAMGGAVAADGSMAMQCQSCHGNMSTVGSTNRVGWFMEPACQQCHTGTASSNNGQIRYTSVFTDTNGTVRVPVNSTFATTPNTPATGLSLYRFSTGHGGLQCSACHGSTHAEFPSTHANDNLRNLALQGHAGVMVECTSCHATMTVTSATALSGPHGIHPVGQGWVSAHHSYAEGNLSKCQGCHGTDFRGTELSRAQGTRNLSATFDGGSVTLHLYRGALVSCYSCHNGPYEDSFNPNASPSVNTVSGNTLNTAPLDLVVTVAPSTAALRVISQPVHGSLGIHQHTLTYFPNAGFTGTDTFTYAAWNGERNSSLATGTVAVAQGPVTLDLSARVPATYPAQWPVAFAAAPTAGNTTAPVTFRWSFGDGSSQGTNQYETHEYAAPGAYKWSVEGTVSGASATASGTISIGDPVSLKVNLSNGETRLTWPETSAYSLLEASGSLGPSAQWLSVTNLPTTSAGSIQVNLPASSNSFYRVRRPW